MTSLEKYVSHFISNVCVWGGVGDWIKTATYCSHQPVRVSFSFSWCSIGGPGAQLSAECWLSLPHLVSNSSDLQLIWSPTHWLTVFTELYNSSITHMIAHSIFGMACLIVIKQKYLSCSSQVTLFRCISLWVYHGLLPCPISSARSAYAISFDFWPLECVTSFRCITLESHVWLGRRSIYNTTTTTTTKSTTIIIIIIIIITITINIEVIYVCISQMRHCYHYSLLRGHTIK